MRLTSLLQRLWLACSAGKEAKWGTIGSMGNMKDIADSVRGNLIPQLYILRRVPMRYSRILPLTIMKRFQCIVVGSAQGVLTVAITDRQNISVIESLRRITGQAIFPVLIDPTRAIRASLFCKDTECQRASRLFTHEAPVPGKFDHDVTRVSENPA